MKKYDGVTEVAVFRIREDVGIGQGLDAPRVFRVQAGVDIGRVWDAPHVFQTQADGDIYQASYAPRVFRVLDMNTGEVKKVDAYQEWVRATSLGSDANAHVSRYLQHHNLVQSSVVQKRRVGEGQLGGAMGVVMGQ